MSKKTLICIHVMPQEIEMFQTFMERYRQVLSHCGEYDVTIKAKKHAPGGLGVTEGRLEANRVAADYLEKNYPGYVSVFHRANGMTEVRMARIKRDEAPK